MSARLLSFVIWAAVAASAVFWGLRVAVSPTRTPAHALTAGEGMPRGDLSRLFGAAPVVQANQAPAPEPALASRFKLLGVAAPRPAGPGGVALIAVDGKPARAFRAGSVVDGDLVLQSVQGRGVSLGPRSGPASVQLELPPLPVAATGNLSARGGFQGGAAAPAPGLPPGAMPPGAMPPGAVPPGAGFTPGVPPAGAPVVPAPNQGAPGLAPGVVQPPEVDNPSSIGIRREQ